MTHNMQVGVLWYYKNDIALKNVSQNIPLRLLFISEILSIVIEDNVKLMILDLIIKCVMKIVEI